MLGNYLTYHIITITLTFKRSLYNNERFILVLLAHKKLA